MKGKKQLLAAVLYRTHLLDVLRAGARRALIVFNYHRIRPDTAGRSAAFDDGVFGPTASEFERQVQWLRTRTRVLSEDELLRHVEAGDNPPGLSTCITFDDGYRDNYTLAYPILKRHRVPAIFFIPTRQITDARLGWWDLIAYLFKQTAKSSIVFDGQEFPVASERVKTIRWFQRHLKSARAELTKGLLTTLADACEVALPSPELQAQELMTWEHVREAARDLVAIGSHSHSDRALSTLDPDAQREELTRSKAILERELGRPVRSLAYPVGGYPHFTGQTQQIAKACGYRMAFSFNTFINDWKTLVPYDIKRLTGPEQRSWLAAMTVLPTLFAA